MAVARLTALVSAASLLVLGSLAIADAGPVGADTPAPTVTAVSPDIGPAAGGTTVLVTGTGFVDGSTTVNFGLLPATDVTVDSPTTLTAVSPAVPSGSYDITVTIPDTDADATSPTLSSATSPADLYAYGPPTVSSVVDGSGPVVGGNTVTISGTGFIPGATATFGLTPATDVTVTSATTLTATVPAATAVSTVDVTVTTPGSDGGTSPTSVNDLYTYGAPTVTSITPITGPADTATVVTITGNDFSPGDTVAFGSMPATDVVVWGSTVVTADAPTTLDGGANVTVTNAVGSSPVVVDAQFAAGAPTVTGISPAAGPAEGGGIVTVTGDGFVAGTTVAFGGVAADGVTVTSPTTLDAGVPAGGSGSVDVTVSTPQGTSATSTADLYAYGVPVVTSVTPDTATVAGGTAVTIAGSGFVPGVLVSFGSVPGTEVSVNSTGTSLQVTSPAGEAGSVDITVTSPAGTSVASINDLFAYGAPVVNSIAPDAGALAGGGDVIVAGNGFVPGVTVYFGDQVSSSVTVLSGGTGLYAVAPAGTAGAVDITVSSDQGTSATSLHDAYFYGSPVVTSVSPGTGSSGGGTTVTITGSGFSPDSTVSFGLQPATSGIVNSSTSITAVAPAANLGVIPVRVTTPAGISPLTPADNFEYDDQLQISCAAPPAITSSCNSIDLPSVNLQGEWQNASAPANSLYVTDDRGDATVGWSLSAYVEPSTNNPNSWCDTYSGFCNATVGSDSANPNAKIPADYLSLTDVGCAPAAGNANPSPLSGSGGNFPVGQGAVALCTAAAGSSAGSFKVDATFSLQVPPWVYAGQYEATVVFLVM
ncbi:MAG: IPT/TIG domain-containing protein [Acidimicrobiales bacterium]